MTRPTVYHSLLGALEGRIAALAAGDLLPAEQKLADEFGVSKPTLRRALAELTRRGLILPENGVGNVVLDAGSAMRREIVFLCRDIGFYAATLAAFSAEMHRRNYFLSVVPLAGDRLMQEQLILAAAERAPSGMVISPDPAHGDLPAYRQLAEGATPLLFLIRRPPGAERASLVTIGIQEEISRVVRRLYREGCRKFAFYRGDDLAADSAEERFAGFLDGLRRCRLRPQTHWQCQTPDETKAFVTRFRETGTKPDAVVCANDLAAAALLDHLAEAGVDARGIRFSGFDHLSLCRYLPRPYVTVDLPLAALGDEAARMIVRQVENRGFKPLYKKLASRVVEV